MNRREALVQLGLLGGALVFVSDLFEDRTPPNENVIRATPRATTDTPASPWTPSEELIPANSTEAPPPTDEPNVTSPETPETPTATPTEAERRGLRALATAERELTDLLRLLTDGYGSELTDVTASSADILNLGIDYQVAIADAQKAYLNAQKAAANGDQRTTAERMVNCWHFLRQTKETQSEVVRGYLHLETARDAFDRVDAQAARNAIDGLATNRRRATTRYGTLVERSTAEDASVIEAITVSEYEDKLAQLDDDISVYRELDDTLRTFAEGIAWLRRAQIRLDGENKNWSAARDFAEKAEEPLETAREDLRDLLDTAGEMYTLELMLQSLRAITGEKLDEVEDILD